MHAAIHACANQHVAGRACLGEDFEQFKAAFEASPKSLITPNHHALKIMSEQKQYLQQTEELYNDDHN